MANLNDVAAAGGAALLQFPALLTTQINPWAQAETGESFCNVAAAFPPVDFNENFRLSYRWTFAFSPLPGYHTFFLDHLPTGKSMGFKVGRGGQLLGRDR